MKRAIGAVSISLSLAVTGLVLSPRAARAEDQDMLTARTLCEHGAWQAAADYADSLVAAGKTDALVWKAVALAGQAAKENKPKLLDDAKKALAEAKAKGVKVPGGLDLEHLPPLKFGTPKFEVEFAWTLKNRGKIGAAEAVIDAAIAGANLPPRELASAKTIRADIFGDRSRIPELGNSDAAKRKEFFEKAKALYLEVANAPGQPPELAIEAKGHLYDLYCSRGQGLLDAVKRADDLAVQEGLKKEALEAFKVGAEALEKECKDLSDAVDKANAAPAEPGKEPKEGDQPSVPQKKPEEWCLIYANYYWPKCLVGQARATTDKAEHDSLVKKALDIYNDYNLRFGQEDQGFEAAIDMADAYHEVNDEDNALVSLESALAIEKTRSPDYDPLHPPDPKKGLKLDPGSLDVFARASLVKGKALKKKGQWKKALDAFDKVFADAKASGDQVDKDFATGPLAKALVIERAEALARDGKMKQAQDDLNKLIKEDESGPTGQTARAMLARLAGGGGAAAADDRAGINCDRALTLMDEALGKAELNTAASWARFAIQRAKEEAKLDAIPRALLGLGQAYEDLGRFYEAAIAYQEITSRYRDAKVAGAAARGVVNAYNQLRYRSPNNHDKQKYEDALKFLTDSFPNEGKGFGDYLLALQYQEEQKYDDAAKYYEKVPADAGDMFDKSLYTASLCRYLLAQQKAKEKQDATKLFQETATALNKAIDTFAKNDGIAEDRKKKRADLDAEARFLLADILLKEAVNKPQDVLTLFEHVSYDNPDRVSRAGLFKILANLKLQRIDAAEAELRVLLEKYKGQKRTVLAARDVASALDKMVTGKKDMQPEERRKIRVRIASYYARWILDGIAAGPETTPNLREMRQVAERLFTLGLDVAGLPEDSGFIQELDDNFDPKEAKQIFTDARDIYAKILEGDNLKSFKDGWVIQAYYGEAAAMVKDWPSAEKGLAGAMTTTNFIKNGQIDIDVVQKNKVLLAYYLDLGKCYQSLGKDDKTAFEKGIAVFTNVLGTATELSKTWWKAKYEYYRTLDARGDQNDYKELGTAMRALERKYPDFKEAAKHGMQEKFQQLKSALEAKGIK